MNFNAEQAEILVKDFNNHITNDFNNFLEKNITAIESVDTDSIDNKMKSITEEWGKKQIPELNNITPMEYVESFDNLDELMKLFEYFSNNSMETIPGFLVDKIYSFGDEALKRLSEGLKSDVAGKDITDYDNLDDKDNQRINIILGTLNAIIHLGDRAVNLCDDVIEFMKNCHEHNELFLEHGKDALKKMGRDALMRIVECINNTEDITGREEYMLVALSDTGYKNGNDEIYKCLKNSFRRMKNKLIGAVLLGDYGDGRAVPMLRKYAMDNKGLIDEQTYFLILGAIDKLGGEIQDLLPQGIPAF